MAATVAVLGSALTTTAGNKTVTATPTVGDLIVIITASTGVTTSIADNGTGGTYTQVDSTRTGFSTSGNLQMWVRNNIIASAASTTYTATQTSSTGGGLVVLRVTGVTATGASAVRSSGGQSTGTAGTTPAPVLSLTPLSTNIIISAVANASNSTTTQVQRVGYTEDFDNGYNTPPTGLEVAHLLSGETSATLTQNGSSATAFASSAIELIVNQPPTVALNSPADTATGVSTTPELDFTGTDADSDTITYEAQVDTVNTFNSTLIGGYDTSITQTADSYSESNYSGNAWQVYDATHRGGGQTFVGDGCQLANAKFYLFTAGSPPAGNITAFIFATTGTNGISAVPTGSALATSDTININTLNTTPTLKTFNFSGANQIVLANGTVYAVVVEYLSGTFGNMLQVGYDLSSPTHAGNGLNGTSTYAANNGVDTCFYVTTNPFALGPYIDATSASGGHDAAQFIDKTNGAHTDPFTSGEQIGFTVPVGETLTASTVYYWRARGKDPSGTNTFGGWPTTRSFTTASSAASVSITQVAATVTAAGGTQSAQEALSQSAGSVTATGGTQSIATVNIVSITQLAGTVTASGGTQTISAVIIASASIAQVAGAVTATGGTQVLATVNNVTLSQTAANVTATGGTQVVATVNNVAVSQLAGTVTASGGTQAVASVAINSIAITQLAGSVTASGGVQTVSAIIIASASVTQVAASVTATGGPQVLATSNSVALSQSAASVTATGGTQLVQTNAPIAQVAATVTATGGTQSIATVNIVAISQVAGSVTAAGGTQVVATTRLVAISQIAGTVTATGGTQTIATGVQVAITQVAGTVTASGGTQVVAPEQIVAITQVAGSVTATGGTQAIAGAQDVSITQVAANVTATGGTQVATASLSANLAQVAATVMATGGTQGVVAVERFSQFKKLKFQLQAPLSLSTALNIPGLLPVSITSAELPLTLAVPPPIPMSYSLNNPSIGLSTSTIDLSLVVPEPISFTLSGN